MKKKLKSLLPEKRQRKSFFEVLDASFKDGESGCTSKAAGRLAQELSNILELSTTIHKSADRGIKNKTEYVLIGCLPIMTAIFPTSKKKG